jgi:hypothetical protein
MQPYFFPYLGYFQLIDKVDKFVLYGNVTFRKKSFITRNTLVDNADRQEDIRVFVKKASSNSRIIDIELVDSQWKNKLVRQVRNIYSKAPYFEECFEYLEQLILTRSNNLHEYNSEIIVGLCDFLQITTPILIEKKDLKLIEDNLNQSFDLPVSTQRVIGLCDYYDCVTYCNPEGGAELYSKPTFSKHNLELLFFRAGLDDIHAIRGEHKYTSIIDVLMHCGAENTRKYIKSGSFF